MCSLQHYISLKFLIAWWVGRLSSILKANTDVLSFLFYCILSSLSTLQGIVVMVIFYNIHLVPKQVVFSASFFDKKLLALGLDLIRKFQILIRFTLKRKLKSKNKSKITITKKKKKLFDSISTCNLYKFHMRRSSRFLCFCYLRKSHLHS